LNFSQVIGQEGIIGQLKNFVSNDKVPHALMLETKEGRGGLALAIAFSNLLQCTDPQNHDSCGHCSNCQKSWQLIHPDIHFSFPVVKADGKKRDESFSNDFLGSWRELVGESSYFSMQDWLVQINAEKSIANINVKECNEVIKKLSLRAFSGGKKALIMWLPEYLGKEGNRLLKLIEEPTDDTVIIFVTHDTSKILNTILSRCQILRIPIIDDLALKSELQKHYEMGDSKLQHVISLAEGNLISARQMAEGIDSNLSEEVISWLLRNYEFRIEELAAWIDNFARETKEYQKQFFRFINYISRTILRKRVLSENADFGGANFDKLANILDLEKLESLEKIADNAVDEINRNISVKIMMMAASLEVARLLRE